MLSRQLCDVGLKRRWLGPQLHPVMQLITTKCILQLKNMLLN